MQSIFKKSGPKAKANEFQVHYWALVLRFKGEDQSILDIAIPTCYFNYPQEVTSAHIDFELKDVINTSTKVEPLHNMKTNQILASGIVEQIEATLGVTFEKLSVPFNSIHRHPGSRKSQSFSGTDLCKDPKEPGVVYPLQSAKNDLPNFAGIMTIDSGTCNVAHYEYRTANGELGTNIEYTKGGCTALITDKLQKLSEVEQLLQFKQENPNYITLNKVELSPFIETLETLFDSIDFQPSTDAINPDYVKSKSWNYNSTKTTGIQSYTSPKKTQQTGVQTIENLVLYFDDKVLEKFTEKKLEELIGKLSDYYYKDNFSYDYKQEIVGMNKKDLISEYGFLRDSIVEEYNEDQEELTKDPIDQMREELASFGVDKATLLTTPPIKIKEWYHNLTGD